jgi:RNA exonuclease 1
VTIYRWSGITEEMLSKATMTLAELQEAFLTRSDLMTPHTILLGHSLENDLLALKLRHPLIIDTSVLYPHARGRPSKASLKWLTGKWLSREIQNKGALGHDSEEDARACLDLLKAKCTQGL